VLGVTHARNVIRFRTSFSAREPRVERRLVPRHAGALSASNSDESLPGRFRPEVREAWVGHLVRGPASGQPRTAESCAPRVASRRDRRCGKKRQRCKRVILLCIVHPSRTGAQARSMVSLSAPRQCQQSERARRSVEPPGRSPSRAIPGNGVDRAVDRRGRNGWIAWRSREVQQVPQSMPKPAVAGVAVVALLHATVPGAHGKRGLKRHALRRAQDRNNGPRFNEASYRYAIESLSYMRGRWFLVLLLAVCVPFQAGLPVSAWEPVALSSARRLRRPRKARHALRHLLHSRVSQRDHPLPASPVHSTPRRARNCSCSAISRAGSTTSRSL